MGKACFISCCNSSEKKNNKALGSWSCSPFGPNSFDIHQTARLVSLTFFHQSWVSGTHRNDCGVGYCLFCWSAVLFNYGINKIIFVLENWCGWSVVSFIMAPSDPFLKMRRPVLEAVGFFWALSPYAFHITSVISPFTHPNILINLKFAVA